MSFSLNLLEQYIANVAPGPHFEADYPNSLVVGAPKVRIIAYYLPQFHQIPENDAWWGKGFTEWTNVTKALPRFLGHYQPHLPGELGFYDLRDPQTLKKQADLARRYGVYGFCFHHYWFAGRRLLEAPIAALLKHRDIDLPFCINWANEPWSRRWDGSEAEVLIAQTYSDADDIEFAAAMVPLFDDPRYIRIDGRPVLMLYRPGLLPDAAATIRRWRGYFQGRGMADPYLIMPQGFGDDDPRRYGFDAAAGFPPRAPKGPPPNDNGRVPLRRLPRSQRHYDADYKGLVARYSAVAQRALASNPIDFLLFPGVCPSWDNEARRPGKGMVLIGSTPKVYGKWLEEACNYAVEAERPDERIVFINAWNEWAEGTHLEPDRHFGYAYLAETARALNRVKLLSPGDQTRRSADPIVGPFLDDTLQRNRLARIRTIIWKCWSRSLSAVERVVDKLWHLTPPPGTSSL